MAILTRLRHLWLGIRLLPALGLHKPRRALLAEMRHYCRQLPAILQQPLPEAMQAIATTGGERPLLLPENEIRELADLACLLERRSPLGICLRRSLTRYHFLLNAGISTTVHFGAKFAPGSGQKPRDIAGHAWLVKGEQPYHEPGENWQGFTVLYRWPQ